MSILCTICARGGSKGVKNKNLKKILKYPLIVYTINVAIKSKLFDKIVLSTDSIEIMNICKKYNIEIFFKRPKSLSLNHINKIDVIRHALLKSEKKFNSKFDYIFDLDVSSPLRTSEDIINFYKLFLKRKSSNAFSVIPANKNPYFNIVENKTNTYKPVSKLTKKIYSRQKAPTVYNMNASIYIWKRDILKKYDTVFTKNTSIYVMNERCIDIDNLYDFELVDFYIKKYKKWQIQN